MSNISLDIISFIEHSKLLNDRSLSDTQKMILSSIYGLPLTQTQLIDFYARTGRKRYEAKEQREATILAGRRSGKTSKIAAPIAIFEAFRNHGLPPGEEGYVLLLAPQVAQARIAFRAILRYLRNSPVLSKRIIRQTKEEVSFDNGITIGCLSCSFTAVRGVTIVVAICDEMAFWRHEATAANPEEEILDALRPGMANVVHSKLIKISTPFGKQGIIWTEFQNRDGRDLLVFQVPTSVMNPTIGATELEWHRQRDEHKFLREFMAIFSENKSGWIDPEILDRCIIRGRTELPPVPSICYGGAIDPAFEHDDFALSIAHVDEDGRIVLDLLRRWRPTKNAPLSFEMVLAEVKYHLDRYGIASVTGDQHCAAVIQQHLLKLGILYEKFRFGSHTGEEIFGNLEHLLIDRKIELLDNPELLDQLHSLEERASDGGRLKIKAPGKMRDDLAVVIAICCSELCKREGVVPPPQLGYVQIIRGNAELIPESCPVAAICLNFPNCLDKGTCQGLKDERLIILR